jgi:Carbohydrate-binding family 9
MANPMTYTIRPATAAPPLQPEWSDPAWQQAETLEIRHFRPEGSDHRPRTTARVLYDAGGLHGIFRVEDRYVRCLRTEYHQEIWKDSCVEFFAEPKPGRGYFNFEFNCGGAFLCSHIVNPERTPDGFKQFTKLPPSVGRTIQARSSLPQRIDEEIVQPVVWTLRFFIPFALFGGYIGPVAGKPGEVWRGNFYKCADESSHPHWGSWAPVDQFNFHRPGCFGTIRLG